MTITIDPATDHAALVSALAYAYSALDGIATGTDGFTDRELRQRAVAAKVEAG